MELKRVLQACDDALRFKDFEIASLEEKNKELIAEVNRLKDVVDSLTFKYEGYKEQKNETGN